MDGTGRARPAVSVRTRTTTSFASSPTRSATWWTARVPDGLRRCCAAHA